MNYIDSDNLYENNYSDDGFEISGPDNIISDDTMAVSPVYPGTPLRIGSAGSNVSIMQSYLNAIRLGKFPSMNRLNVDGVYGQLTRSTVMQYQGFSGLQVDGIIGKTTWDSIVEDYNSLPVTPSDQYPGTVLRPGSSGAAVRNMQLKLNRVSPVYTAINYQTVDGQYGTNMTNAVRRFQAQFGLKADGVIGPQTWDRIVSVHTGVTNNSNTNVTTNYPGSVLTVGSQGDHVRFIQSYFNRVNRQNGYGWPVLAVDGIFGRMTRQVTRAFQEKNSLASDGIIGRNTWAVIIRQFNITL